MLVGALPELATHGVELPGSAGAPPLQWVIGLQGASCQTHHHWPGRDVRCLSMAHCLGAPLLVCLFLVCIALSFPFVIHLSMVLLLTFPSSPLTGVPDLSSLLPSSAPGHYYLLVATGDKPRPSRVTISASRWAIIHTTASDQGTIHTLTPSHPHPQHLLQ